MATSRYAHDRGLSARMGLTMFLLGLLYVVLVGVIFYVVRDGVVAIVIAAGLLCAQWFFTDRIALYAMHGAGRHPGAGAAAARHRRPAVRAGRHAQAGRRDRRHRPAQRVRHRAQPRPRGGLRDHRAACAASTSASSRACSPTSSRTSRTATSP